MSGGGAGGGLAVSAKAAERVVVGGGRLRRGGGKHPRGPPQVPPRALRRHASAAPPARYRARRGCGWAGPRLLLKPCSCRRRLAPELARLTRAGGLVGLSGVLESQVTPPSHAPKVMYPEPLPCHGLSRARNPQRRAAIGCRFTGACWAGSRRLACTALAANRFGWTG